jgi:hypothetical protein
MEDWTMCIYGTADGHEDIRGRCERQVGLRGQPHKRRILSTPFGATARVVELALIAPAGLLRIRTHMSVPRVALRWLVTWTMFAGRYVRASS